MKKILTLLGLFLTTAVFAQFSLEKHSGEPLVDGQTDTYGVYGYGAAELDFYVNNLSTTDQIFMKIEFVSAVNDDGSGVEVCFGLCYSNLVIGTSYPPGTEVVTIEPGQNQGFPGDHIVNLSDGGGDPIEYVFRWYQVDANGTEFGDDLSITYRYDPNLGLNDLEVDAFALSTNVTQYLPVQINEQVQMTLFDLQGRRISETSLASGMHQISVGHLSSQMYLAILENDKGQRTTIKFIKR